MNLALLTKRNIIELANRSALFNEVSSIESLNDINNKQHNAIVIDQSFLTAPDLVLFRGLNPNILVLVLTENNNKAFLQTCYAHNVSVLAAGVTNEEVLGFIKSHWLNIKESEFLNVISVSGTHPQVGCTQTAFSLATQLSNTNRNVAVIGLNYYNPGEIPTNFSEYSFDSIYHSISNQMIDSEEIKKTMLKVNDFYYLVGNRKLTKSKRYKKEHIVNLIKMLKESFDLLILDLGSQYDTTGAIAGLECSQTHLLVGNQQEISKLSFNSWYEQVLKQLDYSRDDFLFICNKYDSESIKTPNLISKELNIPYFAQIPFLIGAEKVEIEEGILINDCTNRYDKSIERVVKGILSQIDETYQIEVKNTPKKKTFSLF